MISIDLNANAGTGQIEFDEIYALLDDPSRGTAEEWAERYKNHNAYQQYIVLPLDSEKQVNGIVEV